jgi:hypothetical protein
MVWLLILLLRTGKKRLNVQEIVAAINMFIFLDKNKVGLVSATDLASHGVNISSFKQTVSFERYAHTLIREYAFCLFD